MSRKRRDVPTSSHPSVQLSRQVDVVLACATALLREYRVLQELLPERDAHWQDREVDIACITHDFKTMQHAMQLAMAEVLCCAPWTHAALLEFEGPDYEPMSDATRPHSLFPVGGRGVTSAPSRTKSSG